MLQNKGDMVYGKLDNVEYGLIRSRGADHRIRGSQEINEHDRVHRKRGETR